jgi:hypothetical protein
MHLLVGKPQVKKTLGRPRCGWEDNIEMYVQEIERNGMEWVDLFQARGMCWALVNTAQAFGFPYKLQIVLTIWGNSDFSKRILFHGIS